MKPVTLAALVGYSVAAQNAEDLDALDIADIDDLLDADLGTIEDVPDFVCPPDGMYRAVVKKSEQGKQKDKTCIKFQFALEEVIQLNNAAEEHPKQGSLCGANFFPDTSVEKQHMWRWLKKTCKDYLEATGTSTLKQMINSLEGQMVIIVTGHRENEEKTQRYMDLKKILPNA